MDANLCLVACALDEVGTQESPKNSNCGARVVEYQKSVDGKANSEPWCMCLAQFLIKQVEKKYTICSPIFKSEHCLTVWNNTHTEYRLKVPTVGSVVIWHHKGTNQGHAGIVTQVNLDGTFETVEGNTTDSRGIIREGDGVYKKTRSIQGFGMMRLMGFLKAFGTPHEAPRRALRIYTRGITKQKRQRK